MQHTYRDGRPIYVQLMDQVRNQILTGVLTEGEQLPSVRELAGQLTVNPNTISRAYRELERDGWLVSVPGKGVYVREGKVASLAHRNQLLEKFHALVRELKSTGMTREEIIAQLEGEIDHA